jgi:hypothetical protein
MTSNPEPIVPPLEHDFQHLRADVTGPDARGLSLARRMNLLARVRPCASVSSACPSASRRSQPGGPMQRRMVHPSLSNRSRPRPPCQHPPGRAGRWPGRADGAAMTRGPASTAGHGAKTPPTEGSRGDQPLPGCSLAEDPAGDRGRLAPMRVAQRAGQREGAPSQQRVALTDGAEALPEQVVTHVPGPTLGLEIIHVAASLWATAKTVWGETHRHRTRWGRAYLEPRLRGETDAVIAAVEDEAHDPTYTATPRPGVQRTRGYYWRQRPYRHDNEYRARGGPMSTGGGRRRLWAAGERSDGAVGNALDPNRRAGCARPPGGAAQWPVGSLWAGSSATTTSPAIRPLRPSAGAHRSPSTATGRVSNPVHGFWSHSKVISVGSHLYVST